MYVCLYVCMGFSQTLLTINVKTAERIIMKSERGGGPGGVVTPWLARGPPIAGLEASLVIYLYLCLIKLFKNLALTIVLFN